EISDILAAPVDKDAEAGALADMKEIFEKSVVSSREIPAGAVISREMVAAKKPGTGIPARRLDEIVGLRARRDIAADTVLTEDDERVLMLIEGETPGTMAKSTGLGLLELPTAFDRLEPDVVITVGDRFETMSTALAATYMNIPLAHTMGGEVSGNIDESIRHAVTKFAHVHFPSSQGAADRIIRMAED